MCIEHRGYFIQQSTYNNHIMIVKDDRMVLHSACTEKKTELQLRGIVDGWIKYLESGNIADIYKNAEGDE